MQAPERLISTPEELAEGRLSYAEMAIFNAQGLVVNPQVAVLMAEVALELVSGYLKQFAVCFDQTSGVMPSKYTAPAAIMQVLQANRHRQLLERTDP